MVILSIVSAKGGVGKTTIAANLSLALAQNRTVVSVDLDPQNALRLHLGVAVSDFEGVGRATLEDRPWSSAVFKSSAPALMVLPYGELNEGDRDAFEVHLSSHPDWLIKGLQGLGLKDTDVVVIDTPPGPSLYQQQVLRAAHFVLVVVHADAASYATIPAMEGLLERYCVNRDGCIGSAYLINNMNVGSALSRDVVRVIRAGLGDRVVPAVVHQDESVREALAFDQLLLQYAPHSEAASDIALVVRWLNERLRPAFSGKSAVVRA